MSKTEFSKLIFIYNANSGKLNSLLDSAHKILSPSTYDCRLCEVTFGIFTENSIWKKFREQSSLEMIFLHKDEFANEYASKFGHKFTFPIVLAEAHNDLEVFVGTDELKNLKNASDLIALITERQGL